MHGRLCFIRPKISSSLSRHKNRKRKGAWSRTREKGFSCGRCTRKREQDP